MKTVQSENMEIKTFLQSFLFPFWKIVFKLQSFYFHVSSVLIL